MNLQDLNKPLPIDSIDFRVQSINAGGYATILAYKDARVDINRLNEVCGVLGWKREHTRENKNCIVSIWDKDNKQWVSKEDTGVESNAEAQKGLASDSFKRACFNWGIGIELYDYPVIQVKLNSNEFKLENKKAKATWELKLKEWIWSSEFSDKGKLLKLKAVDNNGTLRFSFNSENIGTKKPAVFPPQRTSEKKVLTEKQFDILCGGKAVLASIVTALKMYDMTEAQRKVLMLKKADLEKS